MQGFDRSSRIRWLGVALAVTLGTSITCVAQEVGFIDLTQIVARTELRYPAPLSDEVTNRRGRGSILYGRHDDCDVPNAPKHAGALRTSGKELFRVLHLPAARWQRMEEWRAAAAVGDLSVA